jgi:uncharacterized protein (TIGR02594 family)
MKHLTLALSQYGNKEIRGEQDNPEILKYFDEIGFDGAKMKDETAWCSAFINWVCKVSDLPYTGKLNARSWLEVGVEVEEPKLGDLVVFWRGSPTSWKGHVGIYINKVDGFVSVLGGNQGNQVCIAPYAEPRVLKYIRLT